MAKFELSLSSTTYRNHILEGFSRLQRNDEFVDMTLAAEGHLVKVHQNIVALASPYLKELLRSVPSPHPVIFLNGVTHDLLSYILEYIYRGEVQIPVEKLQSFVKVAQALHIAGVKNMNHHTIDENSVEENQTMHTSFKPDSTPNPVVNNNTTHYENNLDLQIQEFTIEKLPNPVVNTITINNENSFDLQIQDSTVEQLPNPVVDTVTINSEDNFDLQMQEPIIETPVAATGNLKNYDLPFSIAAPTQSMYEPPWEINKGNMEIQNTINTNSHGSINVILDDRLIKNNVSQKPVAKIEIISDTIINRNMNATSERMNNPLPQLYTQAILNTKDQDILINNNTSNTSTDASVSSNKIDLSKLLNMGGKLVLPHYNTSGDIIMSDQDDDIDDSTAADSTDVNNTEENNDMPEYDIGTGTVVYTVSTRGALQMILNHFMYYCQYHRGNGRMRRWRCIDYRDLHCRASVDTDGEKIVASNQGHCHPNHAVKIGKNIKKRDGKIFSTIQNAEDMTKKQNIVEVLSDEEQT